MQVGTYDDHINQKLMKDIIKTCYDCKETTWTFCIQDKFNNREVHNWKIVYSTNRTIWQCQFENQQYIEQLVSSIVWINE